MSRIKYDQAQGLGRGRGYFPQLKGLGDKLATFEPTGIASAAPKSAAQIAELQDKRAAKLARRAKQARA